MHGFDLKKFTKEHEDEHFAHLRHQGGHLLTVAKRMLPAAQQKQIQMMAFGGDTEKTQDDTKMSPGQMGENEPKAEKLPSGEELEITPVAEQLEVEAIPEAPAEVEKVSKEESKTESTPAPPTENVPQMPQQPTPVAPESNKTPVSQAPQLPSQQQIIESYAAKDNQLRQAYASGAINPDKLTSPEYRSKSNGWLGVLISSLGQIVGAGQSGPNLALQELDRQAKEEVERQKMNDTKNLNLWKMNREALGSDLAANLATQNQINIQNEQKMKKLALDTKNAYTIAQTNALIKGMEMENLKRTQALAMFSKTSDPAPITDKLRAAKDLGAINDAQLTKIADEATVAKNTRELGADILEAFDHAANELGGLGGLKSLVSEHASQRAFKGLLAPTISHLEGKTGIGLLHSAEAAYTPYISDSKAEIQTKRKALLNYLASKSSSQLAKQAGINLEDYNETNTAVFRKAPEIKQNGHSYKLNYRTGNYE